MGLRFLTRSPTQTHFAGLLTRAGGASDSRHWGLPTRAEGAFGSQCRGFRLAALGASDSRDGASDSHPLPPATVKYSDISGISLAPLARVRVRAREIDLI